MNNSKIETLTKLLVSSHKKGDLKATNRIMTEIAQLYILSPRTYHLFRVNLIIVVRYEFEYV